ncbi:ABC transporter ATP-binding protein [Candidatus Poribacteria bacterium]|nr:ABC transporter ATP-binding protein [Candidatus Poribacteria bacterium]
MIRVERLAKRFGSLTAVDGVSFEIPQGTSFGLLGPNGAGKSTTIHMLTGRLRADEGEVHIDGSSDPTRPEVRMRLGTTPQDLAIYGALTGRENLEFFGRLYGLAGSELRARVDWALDFTGLADRQKDRTEKYSGGMKRRLNLAASLLHDPPVLLFDEPTVGVDPQSRNMLFDRIEELKGRGRTILYTTHYMEEAQRLCDRVAIMDHGHILALDTVECLITAHGGPSTIDVELDEVPGDPAALPGTLEGRQLRIQTDKPLEAVGQLASRGLRFRSMKIERPSLEDVFLNLTGRRLRD